jgi:dihydrofolate reductase
MKKIKLYIAISIDGYIARCDGDLDWLNNFHNLEKIGYGYNSFFESVDTVIMGSLTYYSIMSMDVVWPYKDKTTYIISHNHRDSKENIHFVHENIIDTISKLREEKGKDIWVVGGGKLTSYLLKHDLIDEMIITTIPIILGSGIPLFPDNPNESEWRIKDIINYNNKVIQTIYVK